MSDSLGAGIPSPRRTLRMVPDPIRDPGSCSIAHYRYQVPFSLEVPRYAPFLHRI